MPPYDEDYWLPENENEQEGSYDDNYDYDDPWDFDDTYG